MKRKVKSRYRLSFIIAGIVVVLTGFILWNWISSPADSQNKEMVGFNIERGEPLDEIINRLKTSGLIRSPGVMKLTIMRLGLAKEIQAGEFQISPAWSLVKIAQTLTLGRSDIKVTLIEGWRREEIANEIALKFNKKQSSFLKDEFIKLTKDKEGYLFSDTYFFPKNSTAQQVTDILLNNFQKKVSESILNKMRQQNMTLNEALIIASLVEREAKFEKDRPLVAGILIKRWRNDWGLEIDATVQYALGYQQSTNTWWKQNLTRSDLKIDSPYNTYIKSGLPPAPICNPSLSSIQAVANQMRSEYWFYISDQEGNLHFAETIEQHNANIAKYLRS
jgi:UPF0755 protein